MELSMTTTQVLDSDLDILRKPNRDYIDAVQNADVQRFDEILAQDFLCSNPDGSLADKAQFLKQRCAFSVTSQSFTAVRRSREAMARQGEDVTPTPGRAVTASGWRLRRTLRDYNLPLLEAETRRFQKQIARWRRGRSSRPASFKKNLIVTQA
jgi:uncharacterized protein DUF4440